MAENWKEYHVMVFVETDKDTEGNEGKEYVVIEPMLLEDADVAANYEWADEEQTVLKKKDVQL